MKNKQDLKISNETNSSSQHHIIREQLQGQLHQLQTIINSVSDAIIITNIEFEIQTGIKLLKKFMVGKKKKLLAKK